MNHDTKTITNTRSPVSGADTDHIATWFATAYSPNTICAYLGGWERWRGWAAHRGVQTIPADPADVSAYLTERAESGAAPATVRLDRAGIAAAHHAIGADDPTACEAVRQAVRAIAAANRDKGRGQVKGLDWAGADHAAALAERGCSLAGLRDGVLIRVGSDALLRVSELAALTVTDLHLQQNGPGTITIRQSKTDQEGRGHVRFLGVPTVAAVRRYQQAAGVTDGPLLRCVNKGGAVGGPLGVRSIRRIITRRAADAGIGGAVSGHSLRVGSAQSLAAAGAGLVELQQAGDWKSARMPAHYARHQLAARGAVARLRYRVEAVPTAAPAPCRACAWPPVHRVLTPAPRGA